jgi:micrococcal nuclease
VGVCGVCNIIGNHSYYGDLIYHMPWQQYYNATNPEEWFCTERQALQNGYRKSLR